MGTHHATGVGFDGDLDLYEATIVVGEEAFHGKCYKIEDVTHHHNYCRITYKPDKILIRKK